MQQFETIDDHTAKSHARFHLLVEFFADIEEGLCVARADVEESEGEQEPNDGKCPYIITQVNT